MEVVNSYRMEFVKLITVSKLDNIVLHVPLDEPLEGILYITGHHLIVSSRKEKLKEMWILHQSIDNIEKKTPFATSPISAISTMSISTVPSPNPTPGKIIIKCKDLKIFHLEITNVENLTNVYNSLEKLIKIDKAVLLYPFFYRPMYTILEDGHRLYNIEMEFSKLLTNDEWRVTDLNKNFSVCPSYGRLLIVPKFIDDYTIMQSAAFRDGGRFPVISYKHENGRVMLRSSQPLTGNSTRRCFYDEVLLDSVLGMDMWGYVIDIRSQNLANQCKTNGGGYETESAYPRWRRIHKPLDKITITSGNLADSFAKLIDACNDTNCSVDKWLSRLNNCNWLGYVLNTLNAACVTAQCLDQEKVSVLVHGSTGRDSTLLITSLTQIILNPDCRTIRGFQALIEREWLHAGHPFALRHLHSCYSANSSKNKGSQPTFLLFLDCVHQLHYQFPCSFEFTTTLLTLLFEHSYFSQFGTFLGNSECERDELQVNTSTTSLWSYLNHPDVLQTFLSPVYEPNLSPIWPSVAAVSLVLWYDLYLRWVIGTAHNSSTIMHKIHCLKDKNKNLRMLAHKLRNQLISAQRQYESLCSIKS